MKNPEQVQERVSRMLGDRGVRGLGLIGPLFPWVTVSTVAGLAVGANRRELIKQMTIGIFALFALYAVGLVILIEVFDI